MRALISLLFLVTAPLCLGAEPDEFRQFRQMVIDGLKSPGSPLSFVGTYPIPEGRSTLGSAPDSDIALPSGPARLALVTRKGDAVVVELDPTVKSASFGTDGKRGGALAIRDGQLEPSIRFDQARIYRTGDSEPTLMLMDDAVIAERYRAPEFFAYNPDWKIMARVERHPPVPKQVPDSSGATQEFLAVVTIHFAVKDKEFRLEGLVPASMPDMPAWAVSFNDLSNGRETYGAGRMMMVGEDTSGSGVAEIDFNFAGNPMCAYSEFYVCVLPIPENRLDAYVDAGEKRPASH
jgi:uncharacterized protein